MDSKGLTLLLESLLLAVGAGWAAYQYLGHVPMGGGHAHKLQTEPVVVASADLTFGTKLETSNLKVVDFPKDAVPRGAYAIVDSVLGQTSKVFLVTGEPVLASKLSSVGGGLSVMVKPSMRAISLEINQVTGVSGFVLPGDRVDVLCTIDNANGSNVAVTKTILQNAEVLASGTTTDEKGKKTLQTQAVTIAVDPEGAEAVALGQAQGDMHLVLRNPVDNEVVDVRPTDTRSVLGIQPERKTQTERPAPRPRPAFQPQPPIMSAPPPPPKPETFTIIKDGNISKQQSPNEKPQPNP